MKLHGFWAKNSTFTICSHIKKGAEMLVFDMILIIFDCLQRQPDSKPKVERWGCGFKDEGLYMRCTNTTQKRKASSMPYAYR